jgi:hypothetical protein
MMLHDATCIPLRRGFVPSVHDPFRRLCQVSRKQAGCESLPTLRSAGLAHTADLEGLLALPNLSLQMSMRLLLRLDASALALCVLGSALLCEGASVAAALALLLALLVA